MATKEIRDAIHVFVHVNERERAVLDSAPFQRLRNIHQLALSYLVYPGASHKRFEHSLGVAEVAGRIFDTVTREDKLTDATREVVPRDGDEIGYWRTVLRMAALCHDTGHLPFSHAAEEELLPKGWDHERITRDVIHSAEMLGVWDSMRPKPEADDVVKLALGPEKIEKLKLGLEFTPWQAILAEIIVGNVFGADRIDYLLRDSLHTGVAYGRFDHNRLIETLMILPGVREGGEEGDDPAEPTLGCERGGLESAEALLLARYFMFAQVYFHPTRLIYDQHLKDFLIAMLDGGRFSTDVADHLRLTDIEVLAAMAKAGRDSGDPGHDPARRILGRDHFRVVYQRQPDDVGVRALATKAIAGAVADKFGPETVRYGQSPKRGDPPDFPVRDRDGKSLSSLSLSDVLNKLPASRDEYVFVDQADRAEIKKWIDKERERIIEEALAKQDEGDAEQEQVEG